MAYLSIRSGFVLILMMTTIPLQMVLAVAGVRRGDVPAMYVFGDSTMDVGNNNYLPGDFPRAKRPYYGVDFPGSRPTGRWSNGYTMADFVAKALGFKRSPPAYLSLTPRTSRSIVKGIRGVSYASAGAGILDSTYTGKCIPLAKQVSYFGATRTQIVAKVGACAANELLSKSLFLIGIGSNDIAVFATAMQQSESHKNRSAAELQNEVAALYSNLISNYTATITELYRMGARKFAVMNAAAIGCVPATRVQSPTGACSDGLNAIVVGFNDALRSLLASLGSDQRLHGLTYSLADLYGLMQATIANPRAYGFANVDSACCGGGRFGAETDCQPNSTLCVDRRRYLFWDAGHPTQRAAQLTASAFYDGPAQFTVPISFKKLVRVRNNPGA